MFEVIIFGWVGVALMVLFYIVWSQVGRDGPEEFNPPAQAMPPCPHCGDRISSVITDDAGRREYHCFTCDAYYR